MRTRRGVMVSSDDSDCEPEGEMFRVRPGRDTLPSSTRRTRNATVHAERRAEAEVDA